MARKRVLPRQVTGRPQLTIKWEDVDFFLEAGCEGTKIADAIGVAPDTLYQRCEQEKGMTFTAYKQLKRNKGYCKVLGKQYAKAMQGDNTMLVWVGKQQHGQTDQPKDKQEFNGSLSNLLDVMHLIKSSEDFDALVQLARDNKKETKIEEGIKC